MGDERELFDERAAIAEFDGGADRATAEKIAHQALEQHRHHCEVRWCCGNPSRVRGYIEKVRGARGDAAADKLYADAVDQYRRGNRGRPQEWL